MTRTYDLTGGTHTSRILSILVVVSTISIGAMVVTVSAAPSPETDVSAEEALDVKIQAKQLDTRLQKLDNRREVNVDDDLLNSIDYHLERGNLAFQVADYAEAKEQYELSVEQARTGLHRGYTQGARTLLNASTTHMNALERHGYVTPKMGTLRARIANQRNRLQDATTVGEAEERYNDARAIHRDVQSLSAPWTVRVVDFVLSIWMLIPVAIVLAAGGTWWYLRSANEDTGTGADLH